MGVTVHEGLPTSVHTVWKNFLPGPKIFNFMVLQPQDLKSSSHHRLTLYLLVLLVLHKFYQLSKYPERWLREDVNVPHNQEHILEYCFSPLISAIKNYFQLWLPSNVKTWIEGVTFLNFKSVTFAKLSTNIGKSSL